MTFSAILMLPAVSAINGWPVGHINPPFVKWIHHPNKFQTRTENGKTLDLNYLPRRFLRPCSLSLSRFLGSMIGRTRFKKNPQLSTTSQKDPWGWAVTAVTSIASSLGSVSEDNTAADRTNGSGRDGLDDASQGRCSLQGYFNNMGGAYVQDT